jgi:hypothetical protein
MVPSMRALTVTRAVGSILPMPFQVIGIALAWTGAVITGTGAGLFGRREV